MMALIVSKKLELMRCVIIRGMKNPKLLFWGSFLGAIALVIALILFFSFQNANRMKKLEAVFGNWVTVEGKTSPFTARLPGEPEYIERDLPISDSGQASQTEQVIKQEIYSGGTENMFYSIAASFYPWEVTGNEEENLRVALGGITQAVPDMKLVSANYKMPFSGKNYLEFETYNNARDTHWKGRMFITSRSLYHIYAEYKSTAYNDDEYFYFVNSFSAQ